MDFIIARQKIYLCQRFCWKCGRLQVMSWTIHVCEWDVARNKEKSAVKLRLSGAERLFLETGRHVYCSPIILEFHHFHIGLPWTRPWQADRSTGRFTGAIKYYWPFRDFQGKFLGPWWTRRNSLWVSRICFDFGTVACCWEHKKFWYLFIAPLKFNGFRLLPRKLWEHRYNGVVQKVLSIALNWFSWLLKWYESKGALNFIEVLIWFCYLLNAVQINEEVRNLRLMYLTNNLTLLIDIICVFRISPWYAGIIKTSKIIGYTWIYLHFFIFLFFCSKDNYDIAQLKKCIYT